MNKIDLIIDALDVSESLFYDQTKLQEALQAARELKAMKPVGGMIDSAIAEVKGELAKPKPIYIMGNYAGEGKVVNTSFGLPKGAFEFAPYTGKGEESKIKHSLEPKPEQEPVCDKDPSLCGFTLCQFAKVCKHTPRNTMPTKIFAPNLEQILNAAGFYRREWVGLTVEEIRLMVHSDDKGDWNDLRFRSCWHNGYVDGVNAANAKLKEKNA